MHDGVLKKGLPNATLAPRALASQAPQHSQRVLRSRASVERERASWRPNARLEAVECYGRFEILGRIGRGGMAEILLARERSLTGGARHLVIKRILPEVRELDEMLHMFLEEARVVMGLSHPNLCQIYEVGEQEGTWFIAMEWVNGATLNQLAKRAKELSDGDPRMIARVIAQCAEALHHAHTARDAEGKPMRLVHRDVSPHNIMVAYDGRVKLLDFGIAKSAGTTHHTEAGVVKGKICYMAPEQWLKLPLDARTDVFALGACLYEALAGRMLFKRDTQMQVMNAVISGDVAPLTEVAPEVPEGLAAIAHRALATRPEYRYQSAYEMVQALERFLAQSGDPFGAPALAQYTRRLFRAELQLGPVLERSARAAQLTRSSELVLPPLPPSLLGMAPVPRARALPPPPFALTPSLSLPTPEDPAWSDFGELSFEAPARASRAPSRAPSEPQPFGDAATQVTVPSVPALVAEQPRPPARTLSMRVGGGVRRVALAASLIAAALPLALWARAPAAPIVMATSLPEQPAQVRTGSSTLPAFTLLAPSAPRRALAPRAQRADHGRSTLSINTRPWSTVYLGSKLLGTTPLADVPVRRGALMLKLVDRDGRVHLRRIPASQQPRTAFFDF